MARSRMASGWVWIPLSFVFLLFGVALGFRRPLLTSARDRKRGTEIFLCRWWSRRWSESQRPLGSTSARRTGLATRRARDRGKGRHQTRRNWTPHSLRNGTLTYRNATNDVRFRLTVFPKDQVGRDGIGRVAAVERRLYASSLRRWSCRTIFHQDTARTSE